MKHWKRILSALLIGAMALTLFAGCDKKVKLEDELINQMADYCSTIGLKVEKEKDNHLAESALQYISANCTGALNIDFFRKKDETWTGWGTKWVDSDEKIALLALLPDAATSYYRISWTMVPSDPKSQYYKDPQVIAAAIMKDAFTEGTCSCQVAEGSLPLEDTIHISVAQGQIGGYNYYLVIQRKASVN